MSIKLQREYQITVYPAQYKQTAPISPNVAVPSSLPDLSQDFTIQAAPLSFSFTPATQKIVTIVNPFTLVFNIQRKAMATANTGLQPKRP